MKAYYKYNLGRMAAEHAYRVGHAASKPTCFTIWFLKGYLYRMEELETEWINSQLLHGGNHETQ